MPRTFSRNGPTRGEEGEGCSRREERKKREKGKKEEEEDRGPKTIGRSAYGLIRVGPNPFECRARMIERGI